MPTPKATLPASWKPVSPVNVTSDANVASSPAAGSSVLASPSAPTVTMMAELGAVITTWRTFPSGPAGVARPAKRIA